MGEEPKYLPIYNRKFRVKPRQEENLHREIPKEIELDSILCIKTKRVLRNDSTVAHNSKLYQIMDKTDAKRVMVEEKINGKMAITHKSIRLRYKEITERPQREQKKSLVFIRKKKKKYIPPANHPWRGIKPKELPVIQT